MCSYPEIQPSPCSNTTWRWHFRIRQHVQQHARRLGLTVSLASGSMASLDAEVAVVGAGPVGAVTALFAASGSRVVILDQAHFPRDKPCGEGLLPPGRAILARLGIEGAVRDAGAPTLRGIAFGLLGRPQVSVHFPPHPDGAEGLGVRRLRFDAFLVERLQQSPNVAFHPGASVSQL